MLDIPELVAQERPPLLTMNSHLLGGAGKSLGGHICADAAYRSGLALHIFENDGQRFYDPYVSVNQVVLPPSEELLHDQIADIRVHRGFDKALRDAGPTDCVIYDCAAASLNRHTFVVDQLDIGLRLEAMGRYALILVPTSAREDISREALVTWEVWRDLLPSPHLIVPMISQRDGNVHSLPAGHDLRKLLKLANDGALLLPRIAMSVVNDIRLSGLKLCELGDSRNPLATAQMADKMGMDPTLVQMMRRVAAGLLEDTDAQMQRLGFTLAL